MPIFQGCSLGLERLGLETVSTRFFRTSRSRLGLGIIRLIYIELSSSKFKLRTIYNYKFSTEIPRLSE